MKVGIILPVGDSDGATWQLTRDMALRAEAEGLDSIWLADHLFYKPPDGGDLVGMNECWTFLAALAALTERVEIAPLVLCASFRSPGMVAKAAAAIDEVSGGRFILGVGAGWHDPEYEAFGFPTDHKVSRFEEWVEIVARLVRGEQVTFAGRYHSVTDCVLVPKPTRPIPLLIASHKPRMHGLTAKWADAWNTAWYALPDDRFRERTAALDEALAAVGRDPTTLERTVGIVVHDPDQGSNPDDENELTGPVKDVAAALSEYQRLGFSHAIVLPQPMTERSVERIAEAVRLSRGSR
jgi:alkanesulfonate monooxygenase SsuD/methylene tetrahydromethanopterin reductase-like flavin-dependent oxidoreductase (luciferase family)